MSSWFLSGAFLLLGLWGLLAPYAGPALGLVIVTPPSVEVVDHVVPGVVVLAAAFTGLVSASISRLGVLAVGLAGLWMTGTHAPLLLQAAQGGAAVDAALFHSVPGMALFFLATVVAVASSGEAARERPRSRG